MIARPESAVAERPEALLDAEPLAVAEDRVGALPPEVDDPVGVGVDDGVEFGRVASRSQTRRDEHVR